MILIEEEGVAVAQALRLIRYDDAPDNIRLKARKRFGDAIDDSRDSLFRRYCKAMFREYLLQFEIDMTYKEVGNFKEISGSVTLNEDSFSRFIEYGVMDNRFLRPFFAFGTSEMGQILVPHKMSVSHGTYRRTKMDVESAMRWCDKDRVSFFKTHFIVNPLWDILSRFRGLHIETQYAQISSSDWVAATAFGQYGVYVDKDGHPKPTLRPYDVLF